MTDTFRVKFMHPEAQLPVRKTEGSAGYDLFSVEDVEWEPGKWKGVRTGIAIEGNWGIEAQVRMRSSVASRGLILMNAPATIDWDYTGEIVLPILSFSSYSQSIRKGERFAQLIFNKVWLPNLEVADEIGETARGAGGLGSTGR